MGRKINEEDLVKANKALSEGNYKLAKMVRERERQISFLERRNDVLGTKIKHLENKVARLEKIIETGIQEEKQKVGMENENN